LGGIDLATGAMLSSLPPGRKHQFCLNFPEQMEVAVKGGRHGGHPARRFAGAPGARTDCSLPSTPIWAQKRLAWSPMQAFYFCGVLLLPDAQNGNPT